MSGFFNIDTSGTGGIVSSFYGQVARQTSGTITIGTAGTYQSTGLTGTLDAENSGISLGTTDTFAIKNTSGETGVYEIIGSMDCSTANTVVVGIKLALNGVAINDTDCRAWSITGNSAKLVTSWLIELEDGDEVSLFLANHTNTDNVTFLRGRLVAHSLSGATGPQGPAGAPGGATVLDDLTDVDTTGASTGELLTYDGSDWLSSPAPAEYGDGDPFRPHPVPPASSWVAGWQPGVGSSAIALDLLYAIPIIFEDNITVDRIALQLFSVAGMTGTYTYELAIFNGTLSGPTTIVDNYGTVAISSGTTPGTQSITISESLTGNTIYWLVVGQTQTGGPGPSFLFTSGMSKQLISTSQFNPPTGATALLTISVSAVPASDFTGIGLSSTSSVPKVFLRRTS